MFCTSGWSRRRSESKQFIVISFLSETLHDEPRRVSTDNRRGLEGPPPLTLRGMTSLVTRKRSRWKSDTMSRNVPEVHWDRYVAKLWKF